jgi:small-conductance mechanosensitive channel
MENFDLTLPAVIAWLTLPIAKVGTSSLSVASIAGLLVLIIGFWFGAKLIESALRRLASRDPELSHNRSNVYAWARMLRYLVWIAGSFAALSYVGVDLTGIAIIGGAVGVGIGLGLQSIVANFISGIILLLERTLKIGDFVVLESGVRGHVREISLRFTRVTTNDDVDVIVPNNEFTQNRLVNWTYGGRRQRVHIPFGVGYGSDKAVVKAAALRAIARVPGVLIDAGLEPDVWLVKFGDNSLDFEMVVWAGPDLVTSPGRAHASFMWALHDELIVDGIEIPFPQRDLYLKSGSLDVTLKQPGRKDAGAGVGPTVST